MQPLATFVRGTLDPRPVPLTPRDLHALLMSGCTVAVHCSEPTLDVLHPASQLTGLDLEAYIMPDAFADADDEAPAVLAERLSLADRRTFMRAVRSVEARLPRGERVALLGAATTTAAVALAVIMRQAGDEARCREVLADALPAIQPTSLAYQAAQWAMNLP